MVSCTSLVRGIQVIRVSERETSKKKAEPKSSTKKQRLESKSSECQEGEIGNKKVISKSGRKIKRSTSNQSTSSQKKTKAKDMHNTKKKSTEISKKSGRSNSKQSTASQKRLKICIIQRRSLWLLRRHRHHDGMRQHHSSSVSPTLERHICHA